MLRINDGKTGREENLGTLTVLSSGGVPPAYKALLSYLPQAGEVLDYGSWQGLAGLLCLEQGCQVTFAHNRHSWLAQADLNLKANERDYAAQAMFPIQGSYDWIMMAGHDSPGATAMLASQAVNCLKPQGQLYLVLNGQVSPPQGFNPVSQGQGWSLYKFQGASALVELPWQQYDYSIRETGGMLWTLPGAFSPGGLDAGTRLMLEEMVVEPQARVLDLGAGNGIVGIVAQALGGKPVFVDEDLVALTACRRNLEERELEAEVIFSSNPFAVEGEFACILSNPPYHTDYRVAGSFIEFARRRLTSGGHLYMVVKRADWYQKRLRAVFGGCQVVTGEGYTLLIAENRGKPNSGNSGIKTTRKHQKRLEQGIKRRR